MNARTVIDPEMCTSTQEVNTDEASQPTFPIAQRSKMRRGACRRCGFAVLNTDNSRRCFSIIT